MSRAFREYGGGTRLTLWTSIDRRYISMGAAGERFAETTAAEGSKWEIEEIA